MENVITVGYRDGGNGRENILIESNFLVGFNCIVKIIVAAAGLQAN